MKRNLPIRYFVNILKAIILLALPFSNLTLEQELQTPDSKDKIKLEGRVIADVGDFAGVWHPKFHSFIFAVSQRNTSKSAQPLTVRIIYEYFAKAEDLPIEFFDYSKLYKLNVFRKNTCDGKLKDFAYAKTNLEIDMSLIRVMAGANANLLDESKSLHCYILQAKDYKVKSETK